MTINFNVTGKERKALVQALSELTYSDPVYAGAPTFAYTVGDYTVDKSGVISYPDTVAPEAVALLVQKLSEKGFVPEQSEDEVSTESETDAPIPEEASDFTKTEAADSILDEASVPAEDAPAPVAVETPDVAPEHEEDAQPAEAETEATQGAETPDVAAEPTEEVAPEEDAPAEAGTTDVPVDETPDDADTKDDAADDDTRLTITIPRASLPDDALTRLKQIVANKGILFKNALQTETLPIIVADEEISFPWFTLSGTEGEATAYAQFITALCQMAREQKRILDKPYDGDNDRFAMRIFMVRLGMKGAEYALARKLMMRNLSGNSGWRYGTPTETISIYWNDLTPEKQKELFEALGDNGNYDVHPLAEIPVPRKEDADESV